MALLLSTESLGKTFGARRLFGGISISFDDTQRIGLIGANGSGKSTLLKILAGLEASDEGTISMRRQLKVGYLAQEDLFGDGQTVIQAATEGLESHEDEHELHDRAMVLLGRVGFTDFEQPAEKLSGGWRKRLAIARQLLREPDLLLLDEPTNHLDVEGILWLEKLLKSAPFAYLLVSHDRYFLENTCNRLVELSSAYVDGYLSAEGSYSDFLQQREDYLAAQARNQTALQSKVRREIEWLRRGAKARTTKAKGRIEQAGRMMEDLTEIKARNAAGAVAAVDFTATDRKTRKLIQARKIGKKLGGRQLFAGLDLILSPGNKIGLLGANGSGKTTLIRVLAGELEPDSGEIRRADKLRVVLFDQTRRQLDKSISLRRVLSPNGDILHFRGESMHVSGWARRFLFGPDQLDLPVSELSGGEQARALIAGLILQPADVLILDEPTNDLDIPTLGVLEESLADFPGAVLLVTHDRYMLDRLCDELLWLDGNGGTSVYADFAQWQRGREAAALAQAGPASAKKASAAKPAAPGGPKKLSYMEQRELEQIGQKIEAAEATAERCHKELTDPAVMGDRNRLHDCCTRLDIAQRETEKLYARWAELDGRK
jgi:ABC transport system ATP-binding/permease protein